MNEDLDTTKSVLRRASEGLLARVNVVAAGIGFKVKGGERTPTLSIVCSVTEKVALGRLAAQDRIPPQINGVHTDVVQTGPIRFLQARTERHRPAPGGVSIGHRDITAGTLGCLVKKNGQVFILSNNHVLANSNAASRGDPILQPGPHDGGRLPADHIADLEDFVPISITGLPSECPVARGVAALLNGAAGMLGSEVRLQPIEVRAADNLVDAAIARPVNPQDVSTEILEIGTVQGTVSGALGMAVRKSGRTTGHTTGEILQVDVTANVQYGTGRIARFVDQIMAGPMSQGGDSGSAVLDDQNRLTGLLFAGSDNSTIINRIEHVFSALGVSL